MKPTTSPILQRLFPGGVHLAAGPHASATEGVCAMEVVSLLAGEPFSDAPACACPVVTRFVMGLNDSLDLEPRQRLLGYVERIAGSSAPELEEVRARMLLDWARGSALPLLRLLEGPQRLRFPDPERADRLLATAFVPAAVDAARAHEPSEDAAEALWRHLRETALSVAATSTSEGAAMLLRDRLTESVFRLLEQLLSASPDRATFRGNRSEVLQHAGSGVDGG